VIEVYKRELDQTILIENPKLTSEERSRKFERNMRMVCELRRAAEELNHHSKQEPGGPLSHGGRGKRNIDETEPNTRSNRPLDLAQVGPVLP
jgi:hypothetical protein